MAKKETVTLQNIKEDLNKLIAFRSSIKAENFLGGAFGFTLLSLLLGILTKLVWLGVLLFLPALILFVIYGVSIKKVVAQKAALRKISSREDILISVERLSHISEEEIYEPYISHKRAHSFKTVKFFCFSAIRWRLLSYPVDRYLAKNFVHYSWSKEHSFSPRDLENTSLQGDEFYYVSLKNHPDVAYIYPCKYFELEEGLNPAA